MLSSLRSAGELEQSGWRSYITQPKTKTGERKWKDVSRQARKENQATRQGLKRRMGQELQCASCEKVERSFVPIMKAGSSRRSRLRGDSRVKKHPTIATAAYNLGIILRLLFGIGAAKNTHKHFDPACLAFRPLPSLL